MDSLAKLLFAILFAFFMYSCGRTEVSKRLTDIESYINERPDSALLAIRQIDTISLRTKVEKAQFALLHAIALDKNYIDTSDTRIIQPAVDWFNHHGSPEERLKAWMYLGIEQYNGGHYDQAIVSFYRAVEHADKVEDQNLLGILYSRIAETYTRTKEYVIAEEYIDKSIDCFRILGRSDQENSERIIKGRNLAQLMKWDEANQYFQEMLKDTSFTDDQIGRIESYYAMLILSTPEIDDSSALSHFNNALSINGRLTDIDQYCALAYLLGSLGQDEKSRNIFNRIRSVYGSDNYSMNYWTHRLNLKKNNYKEAYYYLWKAKNQTDSISQINYSKSVYNAQRLYSESRNKENQQRMQIQKLTILILLLMLLFLLTVLIAYIYKKRRNTIENEGRTGIIIDSLESHLHEIEKEKDNLAREKTKAKFAYLSSLYEDYYHLINDHVDVSADQIVSIISNRISILKKDSVARENFEKVLDKESAGIMTKFKQDFPGLDDRDYRLASYIFAGFDNTSIMLITETPSLEYTRVKKNRLKTRIKESSVERKSDYLGYFG